MTALARAVMTHTGLATAVLLLCGTLAVQTQSQSPVERAWPREMPPRPLAAHPVTFPPYDIQTLPNGLQVVVVSHHEQPAISLRMIVRAGAARDPRDRLGLAMMTASLLDQGAGGKTAQEIADTIEFTGGFLGTGAGSDLSSVNAIIMKDSFDLALGLMADVVRRPAFAPEEIERQRQQALSALKVASEDPDTVAGEVIDRLIYGFYPYGLPGGGTASTLTSLTRDDFVRFHDQYYVPNNALLAIVGDITVDAAMAGVKKAFGDWPSKDVPPFTPEPPPPPVSRVIVIDKPDAVQTEIRVGQLAIPRKHDDFVALDQAVKVLGGEGANRLQQVLRTERSLTYGASADLDTYKLAGGIVAETDTRTDATAESLRVIVDQMLRLQRERVYDAELEGAQDYLVGHFPLTIETPDAIATQVLNQLFYELPLEELQGYRARVQGVTADDIQRVARAYFKPDRLSIVLVGNAEGFLADLAGVGFDKVERIPIGSVDLLAADLGGGGSPSAVGGGAAAVSGGGGPVGLGVRLRASPAAYSTNGAVQDARAGEDGMALLKRVIDSRGGLAKLSAIQTLRADADTTLTTPDGNVSAKTRTYIAYPDRVRVEADLPDARIVQVYADGDAWIEDPAGVHDAPPEMLREFEASARRDSIALLCAAAAGELTVTRREDARVDGKTMHVVEVRGDALEPVRLFIDPTDNHLAKLAYEVETGGAGGTVEREETFEDYRDVEGVRFAFKSAMSQRGRVITERTITAIEINPTLDPELFTRPE